MIEYTSEVKATLIDSLASDIDVARAAWVSNYGEEAREKDPKAIEGLIRYLYNNKHMSPFEHGIFKFYIDCPIFVAREFMRHRTFSFNEVSGRYKKLDGRFYVAGRERPLIQEGKVGAYTFVPGSDEQFVLMQNCSKRAYAQAWDEYEHMLSNGIAKEVARDVLPVSTMTQFYASVDPRNLMQFLTLRNDKHALYEIREIAKQMEVALQETMPLTYKAYTAARDVAKPTLKEEPVQSLKQGGHVFKADSKQVLINDDIARNVYPENHLANGGIVTNGTIKLSEPEWAIDSYEPKHRGGDTYNITINNPATDVEALKEFVDKVLRTDQYGRRKLEK